MNLPNSLTVTRIFLVPLLVVVLLTKFEGRMMFGVRKELVGAAIFGLASLTDWLDGYLARRRKQVTALGQVMDPLADKLLTSAAFLALVQMGLAPAWMVAIIIGRELAVTALRNRAYSRGVPMPASPLGKIKMVAQVVAILALILGDVYLPGSAGDRDGGVVGRGGRRAGVGGRLLPALQRLSRPARHRHRGRARSSATESRIARLDPKPTVTQVASLRLEPAVRVRDHQRRVAAVDRIAHLGQPDERGSSPIGRPRWLRRPARSGTPATCRSR